MLAGETLELIEQCHESPAALLCGAEPQWRIPLTKRDRQQRSKKRRYGLNPRCAHGQERFQLVEALPGRYVRATPRQAGSAPGHEHTGGSDRSAAFCCAAVDPVW